MRTASSRLPLVERYAERLPDLAGVPIVSLGEGSTPLLHAERLSERLGLDLWLKWEGANPTGSFKDRGMTAAVSRAVADGATTLVCASTGNTSASAAAYAARAGVRAVVLLPAGAVAGGKLAQAAAVGARLVAVRGSFDEALRVARELGERPGYALVNSLNPYRLQGQKTAAFEIAEELGAPPEALALPYGGGGNTCAYALGFDEWGVGMPRIVAGEAADRGRTFASAIRIGEPAHRERAEAAIAASEGTVVPLSEDEIRAWWQTLARLEGVVCEPASAAGIAALARAGLPEGTRAVAVVTGHGLKDTAAIEAVAEPPVEADPDPDAIERATA